MVCHMHQVTSVRSCDTMHRVSMWPHASSHMFSRRVKKSDMREVTSVRCGDDASCINPKTAITHASSHELQELQRLMYHVSGSATPDAPIHKKCHEVQHASSHKRQDVSRSASCIKSQI
ncbi:hypothetical protein DUNSADRAFT_13417 [Dunaliella salina]|uniref:Encoded protein n=1 Tax=Dunaliella salina TaxID=3046 RepID=A0ABQ7H3D3_DUNSA|nr:hypothetical protein DUNSADRAFT_13417 [Dunaliella salina]|eukprot:KAF5841341.1 hypothetical protein DUNSADRAFT_13417 [Dunaliella salina]